MEVLLVRFNTPERVFIRKKSKRDKISEAEAVREGVRLLMRYEEAQKRNLKASLSH